MQDKINKISDTIYNLSISIFIMVILITNILGVIQLPIYLNILIGIISISGLIEIFTEFKYTWIKNKKD